MTERLRSLKPGQSFTFEGVKITLDAARSGRATVRLVKMVQTANAVRQMCEREPFNPALLDTTRKGD